MDIIPQKPCSKCGITKQLTEFYTREKSLDGRRKECKACFLAAQKHRYETRPDRAEVLNRMREYSNNRYQNNADRREYQAKYLKDKRKNNPNFREKHLIWARAYKKKRNQTDPVYYANERIRRKSMSHRRRAKDNGSYTKAEWDALRAKYNHRCLCCGEAKPLTIDHVVPLVKGGTNDISNIQPLCLECNLRKHTRTIDYRPEY